MGKTVVRLPFGGLASSHAHESRKPQCMIRTALGAGVIGFLFLLFAI